MKILTKETHKQNKIERRQSKKVKENLNTASTQQKQTTATMKSNQMRVTMVESERERERLNVMGAYCFGYHIAPSKNKFSNETNEKSMQKHMRCYELLDKQKQNTSD